MNIHVWPIEKLAEYARKLRKNDRAVVGFKILCLVRSDSDVVDVAWAHHREVRHAAA